MAASGVDGLSVSCKYVRDGLPEICNGFLEGDGASCL